MSELKMAHPKDYITNEELMDVLGCNEKQLKEFKKEFPFLVLKIRKLEIVPRKAFFKFYENPEMLMKFSEIKKAAGSNLDTDQQPNTENA